MGWKMKTLAAVIVIGAIGAVLDDDEDPTVATTDAPAAATAEPSATPPQDDKPSAEPTDVAEEPDATGDAPGDEDEPAAGTTPEPNQEPPPQPAPERRMFLVTRVIDGDTVELGTGAAVRLVGIDTPEEGDCGYDQATQNMVRLVQGQRVLLVRSDEDTDRYGRLLRYVDRGDVDAGLRQIQSGWAIARYDSRDGYGFHARENRYIAADRATPNKACPKPTPEPTPAPGPAGPGGCAAGYQPCIPAFPPDVNCDDVDGPIQVSGADPHGLDADNDGVACET